MKNGTVKNITKKLLSDNWYRLDKYFFEYQREDDTWEKQEREVYDCGDAAAILLIHKERASVILTKQFRMPAYQNGVATGMLVEVCAGLLDGDTPEDCIRKEVLEETGYQISDVSKVFGSFMVPGTVKQKVHFFTGYIDDTMKVSKGGGAEDETENIEVLDIPFSSAYDMIATGEIVDGKSIMLLQYLKIQHLSKG
ncbi:NUDIX domain-containing protein [Cellulophaga sp. L1A9]|uniref:NUDIX domain-containing protein n=1 Tax=Cellulophaga sp. L1A9 TaxID=2686362 RepID=UPI00131E80A2|nr:NUDIX domain-containing protein [Cellulophaga sp. L1A9]